MGRIESRNDGAPRPTGVCGADRELKIQTGNMIVNAMKYARTIGTKSLCSAVT